ncbi:MAG TPA: hypothetical protein VKP59_04235 [Candidatus Thermoplasmatota archaeon]|nr:hypothetical protein [Candidatus Thermoplasmatota archaeon]
MSEENVLGIIPNVQSGMFGSKAYNLIITDEGIIVAQLTNKMLKEEAKKTSQDSKASGEGFLKRIGNQMATRATFHERYLSMSKDQIINETEGNFFISEPEIKKIRIKTGQHYQDDKSTPHQLKIMWNSGKEKFSFTQITTNEAKKILEQLVGKKVK